MGFKEAKKNILSALGEGNFEHEARVDIDAKNMLATGEVSVDELCAVIKKCNGNDHSSGPHHMAKSVTVHVLKKSGWYIKFYFLKPDAVFISVHN